MQDDHDGQPYLVQGPRADKAGELWMDEQSLVRADKEDDVPVKDHEFLQTVHNELLMEKYKWQNAQTAETMIRYQEARLVNEVMADHHAGNDDQPHPFLLKMASFDMQPVHREKGQQVLTSNHLDKFSAKSPKNAHLPPGPGPRNRASKVNIPPPTDAGYSDDESEVAAAGAEDHGRAVWRLRHGGEE